MDSIEQYNKDLEILKAKRDANLRALFSGTTESKAQSTSTDPEVGDTIRICSTKPGDAHDPKGPDWSEEMDATLGHSFLVKNIDQRLRHVQIEGVDEANWWYKFCWVTIVKKKGQ